MTTSREPVVGVMGGGDAPEVDCAMARNLGRLVAQRGWALLTGGRDAGVMAAASAGARAAGGLVIGILPGRDTTGASSDLDVAIVTGMGDARNVINVLSSNVVIACRGGAGTMSEVALALKNGKRVITLGWSAAGAFAQDAATGQVVQVDTPEQAVQRASELLAG